MFISLCFYCTEFLSFIQGFGSLYLSVFYEFLLLNLFSYVKEQQKRDTSYTIIRRYHKLVECLEQKQYLYLRRQCPLFFG